MAKYNKEADLRQQQRKEFERQDKIVEELHGSWTNMYCKEIKANREGKLFTRGYER